MQNCNIVMQKGEGHTRGGMAENSENLRAHESTVMRDELMHNVG
jgi:hypothetical protein